MDIKIPHQLRNEKFRFIKVRKGEKIPIEKSWQIDKNYKWSDIEFLQWINTENYGAATGFGGLIIIDSDSEKLTEYVLELLPKTFSVKTRKGIHFYYVCDEEINTVALKVGETHFGDIKARGGQIIGVGSLHPEGTIYQVESNIEIAKISKKKLLNTLSPFLSEGETTTKGDKTICPYPILNVIDVSSFIKSGISKFQGTHPIHGSSHKIGLNLLINVDTNTFRCWHCNVTGNTIHLIGIMEQMFTCTDIKKHMFRDMPDLYRKIIDIAEKKYGLKFEVKQRKQLLPFFNQNGVFIPSLLSNAIMENLPIITLKDNEDMYFFNEKDGLWHENADVYIKEMASNLLGDDSKRNYIEEVLYFIKTKTYKDREIFQMPLELIPLKNGILNIYKRELKDYSEDDYFLTKLPILFDEDATCPILNEFIKTIVDEKDIELLYEIIAYCLWRKYPIQKAVMMIGEGENGKSTFLSLVRDFLGRENISAVGLQEIEYNRFSLASLYGKYANIYPDLPETALSYTGKFKMLTGEDMITAENKFKDSFGFINFAKMLFSCNKMPMVADQSNAYFRRWIIITFPNNFEGKGDKNILAKLTTEQELSGLLNKCIDKLVKILEKWSLSYNLSTDELREKVTRLSDTVACFVYDKVKTSSTSYIEKEKLYYYFIEYCKEQKLPIIAKETFFKRLPKYTTISETQKTIGKNTRIRCIAGILIKTNENEPVLPVQKTLELPLPAQHAQDTHPKSISKEATDNIKERGGKEKEEKDGDNKGKEKPVYPVQPVHVTPHNYKSVIYEICEKERNYSDVLSKFDSATTAETVIKGMISEGLLFEPRPGYLKKV